MGRLSNEPIIQHFSHPHPLQLSSLDQLQQQSLAPPILSCANCRLPARGGYAYACSPCSYVLHVQCSEMPPLIHHASHRAHPLSLLPVPAYPEGSFDCDACARPGTGFSYHCRACGVDLHTLCASIPLSVVPDAALHPHPLALAFAPPYENKAFSCDVCGGLGSSQWLYRCAPCEFDAHLECAGRRQQQRQQAAVGRSGSVVVQGTPRAAAVSRSGSGGMPGLARAGSGAGGMVRQMVQGLLSTTTQNIGSRFVPGYVGDGGAAVANGGGPGGAWNNGPPSQGGRGGGRGRGGGYNGWNGNGGGGRGGGPPGGRGQGGGSGGPGAGNDPNGAQAASYDYGGSGDGSGGSNYGYVDSGGGDVSGGWNGYVGGGDGGGGGNGDGVDYGSVVDAVGGVDYGSVVDAVAGVGSAVLNAFGGGSEDN